MNLKVTGQVAGKGDRCVVEESRDTPPCLQAVSPVVFTSSLDEVVFCKAPFNTELRTIWPKEPEGPEGGGGSGQSRSNSEILERKQ